MATTLAGVNFSITRSGIKPDTPKHCIINSPCLNYPWKTNFINGRIPNIRPVAASGPSTPPGISEKVTESIKKAEETCAEDTAGGECAAAWDEVEELSAAASHARDKLKSSDPLETYCKDNPETDECRTYED